MKSKIHTVNKSRQADRTCAYMLMWETAQSLAFLKMERAAFPVYRYVYLYLVFEWLSHLWRNWDQGQLRTLHLCSCVFRKGDYQIISISILLREPPDHFKISYFSLHFYQEQTHVYLELPLTYAELVSNK